MKPYCLIAMQLIFWALYTSVACHVHAQTDSVYVIARLDGIQFDGRVNEAAWDSIVPVPMVQYEPDAGMAPTEKTEIRFGYDDTYFYASMRAFDRDPAGIRATSLYRDRISGSDHFEILLDTYNDNENAYVFTTTPVGLRNDLAVSNDATGGTISSGSWLNRDFNTFWDVESTISEDGWFTEMRIPFSSLRFQDVDGEVVMGITVQRKVARKLERLVWPAVAPVTNWAFLRPSLAQKVLFRDIKPSKTIYITPYLLGGLERRNQLNEAGTRYLSQDEVQTDIGADIKFSITNNLTADFTVNTDFAQVEADDQLVNLTRFSLFFPEKRQFFQERASVFDFRTGGQSRLFFSRRIGLTSDGLPVPIFGGARLIGRVKTWDVGFLSMQTQSMDQIPSENFGVLRVRRRIFNQNSFIGGMITSRIDVEGNKNLAYGIDGLVRVFGDDYLTIQWAQTFDNQVEEDQFDQFKSGRLALELNRRRRSGFGYNVGTIISGSHYNPGVGFVDRNDFKFGTVELSQTWLRDSGSFIWHQFRLVSNAYINNGDNELLSSEMGLEWSFSRRNLDNGSIALKRSTEQLLQPFNLSNDVQIPIGSFDFYRFSGSYSMAVDKTIRTGLNIETGSFYDGWLNSLNISPSWYISKHLQLNLEYEFSHASFSKRDDDFNFHIARLRIGTAVNRMVSTNAFVQYNSAASLFSANVRFRYNFREGQDLWVVLNTGLNTRRNEYSPPLPIVNSQSVMVKYVHTFIL